MATGLGTIVGRGLEWLRARLLRHCGEGLENVFAALVDAVPLLPRQRIALRAMGVSHHCLMWSLLLLLLLLLLLQLLLLLDFHSPAAIPHAT